jgi:FHS family L-fucose permease-like MFS transporter
MASPGLFRTADGRNHFVTFACVTSLFLLWAVLNSMIDTMDKHFQDFLHLSKAESARVQFAHYLGYFLMALPAGWLAQRLGYKGGIISGLLLVALGCLWFIPATGIATFWAFLLGVCVVSMCLTFLETIANPYTTVLGAPQYAAVRINTAQTFNGVGWLIGPYLGGMFFFNKAGAEAAQQTLWIPYAMIAAFVIVLAAIFVFIKMPDLSGDEDARGGHQEIVPGAATKSLWANWHFVGAVVAQFFYVAAQAGIFSFFINYVTEELPAFGATQPSLPFIPADGFELRDAAWAEIHKNSVSPADNLWHFSGAGAAILSSLAFLFFLAGRFTGSGLLTRFSAHRMIGIYALINIALCAVVAMKLGWVSLVAVLGTYFFMSIMFPTIFALGIFGLGAKSKWASAFIVMAIMGGACMPMVMGGVADKHGMSAGFLIPLLCFVVIAIYGFIWPKLSGVPSLVGVKAGAGH